MDIYTSMTVFVFIFKQRGVFAISNAVELIFLAFVEKVAEVMMEICVIQKCKQMSHIC